MKNLIDKSFLKRSQGNADLNEDQGAYMEGGQINYGNLTSQNEKASIITER